MRWPGSTLRRPSAGRLIRWGLVGALIAALLSTPSIVGALPAGSSDVSAADLLARITASADVPFSGYAESVGGLDLPIGGDFSGVSNLLSGTTQLRVWSRDSSTWRVDTIGAFGETDVHSTPAGLWTWDYEKNTATLNPIAQAPRARLPRSDDLVPGALARRLLSGVDVSQATRIDAARIAGHTAAGVRVRPNSPQATVDHIDVWAIPTSGLVLRVDVVAAGSSRPVVTSSMLDVSTTRPAPATVAFTPPSGTRVTTETIPDVVSFFDQVAAVTPPAQLAGLNQARRISVGSVGVYGNGITTLVAVPLLRRTARSVRTQILKTVSADADESVALGVGPLNLRLGPPGPDGSAWLVIGTVTPQTLTSAIAALPAFSGPRR